MIRSKKMLAPAIAAAVIIYGAAAAPASAATVHAQYAFGSGTSTSLASSDNDSDSTASDIVFSNIGHEFNIGLDDGNPRPDLEFNGGDLPANQTKQGALDANQFFSFTITPNVSTELNLGTLTFQMTSTSQSNWDPNVVVRSSVDSYANDLIHLQPSDIVGVLNYDETVTVDLSTPAFQGLESAIGFRFYVFNSNTSTQAGRLVTFDNVSVTPVPEPASLSLLGLGGLLMLRRTRRGGLSEAGVERGPYRSGPRAGRDRYWADQSDSAC